MKAPIEVSPLAWLEAVESQRREAGLRRSLRPRPAVATELDLASNDYLRRPPAQLTARARQQFDKTSMS